LPAQYTNLFPSGLADKGKGKPLVVRGSEGNVHSKKEINFKQKKNNNHVYILHFHMSYCAKDLRGVKNILF
jgi:hypothetical protein